MDKSLRATLIRAVMTRKPGNGLSSAIPSLAVPRVLAVNSVWLLITRVTLQAQGILLTLLLARRLGAAGFGQYSLIASLIFLGNVFTTFGTDILLIRQIARERRVDLPEIRTALGLQLVLSAGYIAAIWLWTLFNPPKPAEFLTSLRLYSISLLPLALFSVFSAMLRGFERMDLFMIASLATACVQIAAVWSVMQAGGGLTSLVLALLVVQIFAMVISFWLCKKAAPTYTPRWSFNLFSLVHLVGAAWPVAALSILGVINQRMGIFALSILGNDVQTGLYSSAARIVDAMKLGHIAIAGAMLPALARQQRHPQGSREAHRIFRNTTWILLGFGVVGAWLTFLFAEPFIRLLYGARYAAVIPSLRLLGWILIPYSLSTALAVDMVSKKMEKWVTLAVALGLAATAGLDMLWIPIWGVQGACLGAILGENVQAGALWGLRAWHEQRG
jgi:O-antigen/teichoic acid export membrane protein